MKIKDQMIHPEFNFYELNLINEKRLEEYLDLLELVLCKRCWRRTHNLGKPYHHHGGILQIIESAKLSRNYIDAWKSDLEHGLCHGLVVGFFATFLSGKMEEFKISICTEGSNWSRSRGVKVESSKLKPYVAENFIMSCLFHDLMKCVGEEEDHDLKLRNVFSNFEEEIYTHGNPPSPNHPLVKADRLELFRFDDHEEWVDMEKLRPALSGYGELAIRHFYKHIRPVIKKVIEDIEDVWFSHVLEESCPDHQRVMRESGYPDFHWRVADPQMPLESDTELYFSVNSGFLPFDKCLAHTQKAMNGDVIGLISKRRAKSLGVEVTAAPASSWGRDHVFFKHSGIPYKEWLFLYTKKPAKFHTIKLSLFNKLVYVCKEILAKLIALA